MLIGDTVDTIDALGAQSGCNVAPGVAATDMGDPELRWIRQDQREQVLGVAICGHRVETRISRGLRCSVTNTPRGARDQTKPFRLCDAIGRGENHPARRASRINGIYPLERRQNHPHIRKPRSEFRAIGGGACDDQGGLHRRTIVWNLPKCYLPITKPQPEPTMTQTLTILGIESSCDDTAAAVVRQTDDGAQILSSIVHGQTALHADFGGVVPEIAARAHVEKLDGCVEQALDAAGLTLSDIDAVAVTAGPGLIGGVVSGVMLAKGICAATGLPLIGVNHLAGHALTPRLTDDVPFPYLMLLVSGGHCQFLLVKGHDDYTRLGGTIDDAPGEAFDKTARILGLPQPGGPSVQKAAETGDGKRFKLPRPLLGQDGCDMSFSGLKTAMIRARDAVVAEKGGLTVQDQADLSAGFQGVVAEIIGRKSRWALERYMELNPARPVFAVAGGVAANTEIRARLTALCAKLDTEFVAPPLALCTDNAAMIAFAGLERFAAGQIDDMTLSARPRWPLDQTAAPMLGSGKKGAKA